MSELTRKEKMQLKFMEIAIARINTCLINIHALQSLLIRKRFFTEGELCAEIKYSKELPLTSLGKNVLNDMIKNFNINELQNITEGANKNNLRIQ